MNAAQIFAVLLVSAVSLYGLWLLAFWLYPDYCVDTFRQRMFMLRDQLFDEAADELLPFTHPAYGMLRSTMNGFIQFGHRLTFTQVLLMSIAVRAGTVMATPLLSFEIRWAQATHDLGTATQQRLVWYRDQMNYLALRHIVFSSPLLLITIILPVTLWIVARSNVAHVLRPLHRPIDNIDTVAMTSVQT
jgi:hypothetical protein